MALGHLTQFGESGAHLEVKPEVEVVEGRRDEESRGARPRAIMEYRSLLQLVVFECHSVLL
jgi:hypothetical protein